MLLTVDIGNTQTVLGVYKNEHLLHMWRLASNKTNTSDELRLKILPLFQAENLDISEIEGIIFSSVVPELNTTWNSTLFSLFKRLPLICSAESAQDLFLTSYENPNEIGADRIADAVAARAIYGAPVLVLDFGTATNLEVIDKDGYFIGGVIAPGLETSASALFSHATKLPAIDLNAPENFIGTNTTHAMQSGIVFGEADRVDGFVKRVFNELGYECPVIATGGLASKMAPLCKYITEVNPQLTLEGLRLIYEQQKN